LSALFDRLAQQIEACLLAVFAAPEFLQHAALQTFALKLKGGCQRHDIEIAGGQKVIQLQGSTAARRGYCARDASERRDYVSEAERPPWRQEIGICRQGSCALLQLLPGGYYSRLAAPLNAFNHLCAIMETVVGSDDETA
jgi:hypothetical protein